MFKKAILIVFIISFCMLGNMAEARPKTSRYEFFWSVAHPFAALKINRIYKNLKPFYVESELKKDLDSYSSGGKLDACRHIYYMAAFAQKIKSKKVLKLGKAHEKTNYLQFKRGKLENEFVPDSMSCVMDLKNNEIGVKLGKDNKELNLGELLQVVIKLVQNGDAFYLAIDDQGRFLDCQNNVINLNDYKGKWFVPKCLLGFKTVQVND